MPIHVDIWLNDKLKTQLHIARIAGKGEPDSMNTYTAVYGEAPEYYTEWMDRGTVFRHRYGDGLEECVRKALEATVERV